LSTIDAKDQLVDAVVPDSQLPQHGFINQNAASPYADDLAITGRRGSSKLAVDQPLLQH
jgi:hypothetical protein